MDPIDHEITRDIYGMPGNTRDVRVMDPDGYVVVYTARRPEGERDERFSAMMRDEAARQLDA